MSVSFLPLHRPEMPPRSPVRIFCAGVVLAGVALVALTASRAGYGWILHDPVRFAVMSAGVLLGEMLPIRIPRPTGDDEELTLSAAFALALLMVGGLGPALIAQAVASAVQDVAGRKPGWRVRFNAGQYTVAMVPAWLMVRAIAARPGIDLRHPFSSGQLPALLVAAIVFFLVNRIVVGVAVALHQGAGVRAYFADNAQFGVLTGVIILLTAPIVLAAASYTVVIVPLCLLPVVAMYRSISESARSEQRALHDPLTNLPNRTAFQEAAARAMVDPQVPGCVLLLDLDRFKEVNDTLGHRYGDLLLVQVAERFEQTLGTRGEIARLGGDEFALVAGGCDGASAVALAHEIVDCLRRPFQLEELVVDTQASVGIALFPEHGSGIETLLQRADVAMYQAKESRSDLELYDERYDHYSPARLALTGELRSAIDGDAVGVWYQPQLDLRTGAVPGVEALVRWEHPTMGLLLPGEFVRMAEQSNLIKPLTRRVIEIVLGQAAAWRAAGLEIELAVNISPQVLVDRTFTQEVLVALRRAGVPPSCLKLEVTEGALMSDPVTARSVLRELDALGIAISIDDFGTGYSSLAYLADLPVSEVKIDQSFVSRMTERSNERIIVNSTIDLAHHLGLRAVAEGVEDPALVDELRSLGCDVAQGFAISRPMPADAATRWLRRDAPAAPAVAVTAPAPPAAMEPAA